MRDDNGMAAQRVPWPRRLRRVFGLDALACARCGATMTALAVIGEPDEAARLAAHLEDPSRSSQGSPPTVAA